MTRFKDFKGYRFDRYIFRTMLGVLFGFLVYVYLTFGVSTHYWTYCPETQIRCENPYIDQMGFCKIDDAQICAKEYFLGGEGERAPWIVGWWDSIVFVIVAGAFVLNHFLHNGGKHGISHN